MALPALAAPATTLPAFPDATADALWQRLGDLRRRVRAGERLGEAETGELELSLRRLLDGPDDRNRLQALLMVADRFATPRLVERIWRFLMDIAQKPSEDSFSTGEGAAIRSMPRAKADPDIHLLNAVTGASGGVALAIRPATRPATRASAPAATGPRPAPPPLAPEVAAAIEQAHRGGSYEQLMPALAAIAQAKDPRALEALVALVSDENSLSQGGKDSHRLHEAVLAAFRAIDSPSAVPPLLRLLEAHEGPQGLKLAAQVLGQRADARAVEPLLKALVRTDASHSRHAIADALLRMGDERVLPALQRILGATRDRQLHSVVAYALGRSRQPEALATLVADMNGVDDMGRLWDLTGSLVAGDPALAAEAMLARLNSATDRGVRLVVCHQLGETRDARAVPAMLRVWREDKEYDVRCRALRSLSMLPGREAADAVLAACRDRNPAIRQHALNLLWHSSAARQRTGEVLEACQAALLGDPVADVRQSALLTLWDLRRGDAAGVVRLVTRAMANDRDPAIRAAAAEHLRIGQSMTPGQGDAPAVVAALMRAMSADPDVGVRDAAARSLESFGERRAVMDYARSELATAKGDRADALKSWLQHGTPQGALRAVDISAGPRIRETLVDSRGFLLGPATRPATAPAASQPAEAFGTGAPPRNERMESLRREMRP